jgi:hypothetical protein
MVTTSRITCKSPLEFVIDRNSENNVFLNQMVVLRLSLTITFHSMDIRRIK